MGSGVEKGVETGKDGEKEREKEREEMAVRKRGEGKVKGKEGETG